jgi:hypothetical protein
MPLLVRIIALCGARNQDAEFRPRSDSCGCSEGEDYALCCVVGTGEVSSKPATAISEFVVRRSMPITKGCLEPETLESEVAVSCAIESQPPAVQWNGTSLQLSDTILPQHSVCQLTREDSTHFELPSHDGSLFPTNPRAPCKNALIGVTRLPANWTSSNQRMLRPVTTPALPAFSATIVPGSLLPSPGS